MGRRDPEWTAGRSLERIKLVSKNKIHQLQQSHSSRVFLLRSPAEPDLDLRARLQVSRNYGAIMASGESLAGVKQTPKEKRTSETTDLDLVPSWACLNGRVNSTCHRTAAIAKFCCLFSALLDICEAITAMDLCKNSFKVMIFG
jgi:hypothetical protein